ncbi:MAG: hypothetical protein M0Z34_02695 [Nitrospiraceae bacterium]|nr:hypothetical protein [Nitrospiraceae bacterium]
MEDSAPEVRRREPRWPASIAILASIGLYVVLPQRLILGPRWLMPLLELGLLIPLTISSPFRDDTETKVLRYLAISVIGLLNLANAASVWFLVHDLLAGGKTSGPQLVYSAVAIWLTNVIVFGLWFWELDRGGPAARAVGEKRWPDFLFPQMLQEGLADPSWMPGFIDYIFVAFTNATAFSPTDTMPLTGASKALMTAEALISVITVVMVAGRAVNILP